MAVTFVTNFCPHYRVRTFELLHDRLGAEFLFFSRGGEAYWPDRFGVRSGGFPHVYLKGVSLGGTRLTPGLVPRLLADGDPVIKCINGRFALPASYAAARLRGRPFVLWTGVWHRLGSPFHRLLYPVTRRIYRRADAVVVYGEHVKRFLVAEGVEPERVFVAPHAVDNDVYRRPVAGDEVRAVRERHGVPEGAPLVLFVGRLTPEKGVDLLLDAFARGAGPDAHLLLVGRGPARDLLEDAARRLGVAGRVHFEPSVQPGETIPFYAAADLLALPSRTTAWFKEPWGLVVNEAFNQGLPVVASDAVGAAAGGLVVDGATGRVVPEGDVEALAAALADLLGDDERRRAMGRAARERVLWWSHEAMADAFGRAVEHARAGRGR